jgi:hypothetical protein
VLVHAKELKKRSKQLEEDAATVEEKICQLEVCPFRHA